MIVNVRGTSGSGKTTTIRRLMDMFPNVVPLGENPRKPEGYKLWGSDLQDIYILGSYENVCGGCDGIKTQDEICERIRRWYQLGHVIFEGLLVSTLFSRYNELAAALRPVPTMFVYLDTPVETCVERVLQRRLDRATAAGKEPKQFDDSKTRDKWNVINLTAKKFKAAGADVRVFHAETAAEQILEALRASS